MRQKLILLTVIAVMVVGCKKFKEWDSISITDSGKISGRITSGENYIPNTAIFAVFDCGKYILYDTPIANKSFGCTLPTPKQGDMFFVDNILTPDYTTIDINISNPEAKIARISRICAEGQLGIMGIITKGNLYQFSQPKTGMKYSIFLYSTQWTQIKGELTSVFDAYKERYAEKWDVSLRAGWNELSIQFEEVAVRDNYYTEVIRYTTKIPSGMMWIYTPYARSSEPKASEKRSL